MGGSTLQERLFPISRLKEPGGYRLEVRICSSANLLTSITRSTVYLPELLDRIKLFYPSKTSPPVLVLISRNCLVPDDGRTLPTEIWATPRNWPPPDADNAVDANDLIVQSLNFNFGTCASGGYEAALAKARSSIKNHSSVAVGIIGYFAHKPNPILRKRVSRAKKILEADGFDETNLTAAFRPYTGDPSQGCTDKSFVQPAIYLVATTSK
jgi:hypothetical protein